MKIFYTFGSISQVHSTHYLLKFFSWPFPVSAFDIIHYLITYWTRCFGVPKHHHHHIIFHPFEYFIWALIAKIAKITVNGEKGCKICDDDDDLKQSMYNILQFRGDDKVQTASSIQTHSQYLENYRPYMISIMDITKCYVTLYWDVNRIGTKPSISAFQPFRCFSFVFIWAFYLFKFSQMNAMR